ncbi:MAG: sortase, partial [Acidobacteriota bacterium]
MEAGFDYLLLRGRLQRRFFKSSAVLFIFLGIVLLAAGGAYYGYAAKARADLDDLNVTLPGAITGPGTELGGQDTPPAPGDGFVVAPASTPEPTPVVVRTPTPTPTSGPSTPAKTLPGISGTDIGDQGLFPGGGLLEGSWGNPLLDEPPSLQQQLLLQGFDIVGPTQRAPLNSLSEATRIIVPSIDVDFPVSELRILDLGESRVYETPNNTIGHIPATANAGESSSSWFFGHTESPTMGEGSVFFNLRKVPSMLRNGEQVYVIADNGENQYLYRVTSTEVI